MSAQAGAKPARWIGSVLGGILLVTHCTPARAAADFRALGTGASQAQGVSGDGAVVVGGNANGTGGFRWTRAGGVQALGFTGTDASSDGSVIVGFRVDAGTGRPEAIRWTNAGGAVGLGDLNNTDSFLYSQAWGVSADGSVVVGYASGGGNGAFRWTAGTMTETSTSGSTCTNQGIAVDGVNLAGNCSTFAYRVTGGVFSKLADATARVEGISSDGNTIVGYAGSNPRLAASWVGGVYQSLGDLAGGATDSYARAVSTGGGCIVGRASSAAGNEAFVWDAANGMRSLQDVLINENGLATTLAGWILTEAMDVSDDCSVIVGYGTDPAGQREAWVVTGFGVAPPALHLSLTKRIYDVTDAMGVHWGGNPRPGDHLQYRLQVENTTNSTTATQVQITDTLPEGLSYVSNPDGGTYDSGSRSVAWLLGSIAPHGLRLLDISASVQPGAAAVLTNRIFVTAVDAPFSAGNGASATVNVVQYGAADLQIGEPARTDDDNPAASQYRSRFAYPVKNNGPNDAYDTVFAVVYQHPLENPRQVFGDALEDQLVCTDRDSVPQILDAAKQPVYQPGARAYLCVLPADKLVASGQAATLTVEFDRAGNVSVPDGYISPPYDPEDTAYVPRSPDPDLSNNAYVFGRVDVVGPKPPTLGGDDDPNRMCFIATAAYGTPFAAEVKTLREFRDRHLLTNGPGRAFVAWYYRNSPPVAGYIRDKPHLRAVVRGALTPLVFAIRRPVAATVLSLSSFAILVVGIRWRRRRHRNVLAAALH